LQVVERRNALLGETLVRTEGDLGRVSFAILAAAAQDDARVPTVVSAGSAFGSVRELVHLDPAALTSSGVEGDGEGEH
jgi:hypothetical protein